MRRESGGRARYEEIAQDLAKRVVSGDLAEGARILGRSSLAGTYQVSPETIRRAVAVLHERGVLQSVSGSGIRVLSRHAAVEYLDALHALHRLEEGNRELFTLMKTRRDLDDKIEAVLHRVLSQATGAFDARHIEEILLKEAAWAVGQSLNEIRLRTRTGATAVVVTRGEVDHFSPQADMRVQAGDVITVLGSDAERTRARELLSTVTAPSE